MIGRSWRILALLVAALLAVPSLVLARAALICSMTGQRTFTCCCSGTKAEARPSGNFAAGAAASKHAVQADAKRAHIEAEPCCKYDTDAAGASSASFKVPAELLGHALVDHVVGFAFAPRVMPVASGWSYRGPPELGPPLFIKHCTLLI